MTFWEVVLACVLAHLSVAFLTVILRAWVDMAAEERKK